jgi:hypothetical protein
LKPSIIGWKYAVTAAFSASVGLGVDFEEVQDFLVGVIL